jgi:hypothetical protein
MGGGEGARSERASVAILQRSSPRAAGWRILEECAKDSGASSGSSGRPVRGVCQAALLVVEVETGVGGDRIAGAAGAVAQEDEAAVVADAAPGVVVGASRHSRAEKPRLCAANTKSVIVSLKSSLLVSPRCKGFQNRNTFNELISTPSQKRSTFMPAFSGTINPLGPANVSPR